MLRYFLALFQTASFAETVTRRVTTVAEIIGALQKANVGDKFTFEIENDIYLGQKGAKLDIPLGVTVVLTNAPGVDVKILRDKNFASAQSRIDVDGSLIIEESAGGSLKIDGERINHKEHPVIALDSAGSALTINSGTICNHNSYWGAIYSCDEANTTINGGTFSKNTNTDAFGSQCQGGLIYAANSNLTIKGGAFTGNESGMGGAIYFEGRTAAHKLIIDGGEFDKNTSWGFGGGAVYIDLINENDRCIASITGGRFTNNSAFGLGGAIYIQKDAEVTLTNSYIYENAASGEGGGIWNCATGGGNYYSFHGMYLAKNTAKEGADFYSLVEAGTKKPNIYLSDYVFTGEAFDWLIDADGPERGNKAPNDYYQNTKEKVALKSGLNKNDALLDRSKLVLFSGNIATSGGAIANNGYLQVGEETRLSIEKQTTVATEKEFTFVVTLTRDGNGIPGSFVCRDSESSELERIIFDDYGKSEIQLKAGQIITILDLPVNAHFEVEEVFLPDGWKLASSVNQSGNITADAQSVPNIRAVFTNKPLTGGDLTVSKTVSGDGADRTKKFNFTITITDGSGAPLSGTYSGLIFTGGRATFQLAHNEKITIGDLPEGVSYAVTEDSAGYAAIKTGDTGIISASASATAAFINYKPSAGVNADVSAGGDGTALPTPPDKPYEDLPQTGDDFHAEFWLIIALASFAGGVVLSVGCKKRKR